jgi:hypothetical protein
MHFGVCHLTCVWEKFQILKPGQSGDIRHPVAHPENRPNMLAIFSFKSFVGPDDILKPASVI